MESSPSSSSVSTVIDFQGKRQLLSSREMDITIDASEATRPSDQKREKLSSNTVQSSLHRSNRNEAILLEMEAEQSTSDVLQAIRENFLAINPVPSVHPPSQSQSKTRRFRSRIPIRSNSSSQSRSRSPKQRPPFSSTSKIPVRTAVINPGAFQYVQSKESSSSDDHSATDRLKDEDLKKKLLEEKRQRKRKGQLLDQLQENYKDLLEKYAQAENTIDQLRFQPKLSENNTPTNNSTEIVQASKIELSTIKYPSFNETPLSSIRPVASSSITTPVMKNPSADQTVLAEEDLLNQSRTCGGKMKTFLTLMDANQLSLAEQKQAYETIRQDYQRLLQAFHERRALNEPDDNQTTDLNEELTNMKQLLKEIVKQMTEDLLEKSLNSSRSERGTFPPPPPVRPATPPSPLSVRSSLCNQDELMNQYQKILTAVNQVPTAQSMSSSSSTLIDEEKEKRANVDVSESADSTRSDRTTPTPFSLGGLEFDTVGQRSSDGMVCVMVEQEEESSSHQRSMRRSDREFISNVSSHFSSASSSESLTSRKLLPSHRTTMDLNNRRNLSSTNDQPLHRSTHTWRPQKTKHRAHLRPVDATPSSRTYRSALYIEPKRVVRYTTISQPRFYSCQRCRERQSATTHRSSEIDDLGYESESKSKRDRRRQRADSSSSVSSSNSHDSTDLERDYRQMINLNEAYARAAQIESESRRLARSIRRMLKVMMSGRSSLLSFDL